MSSHNLPGPSRILTGLKGEVLLLSQTQSNSSSGSSRNVEGRATRVWDSRAVGRRAGRQTWPFLISRSGLRIPCFPPQELGGTEVTLARPIQSPMPSASPATALGGSATGRAGQVLSPCGLLLGEFDAWHTAHAPHHHVQAAAACQDLHSTAHCGALQAQPVHLRDLVPHTQASTLCIRGERWLASVPWEKFLSLRLSPHQARLPVVKLLP